MSKSNQITKKIILFFLLSFLVVWSQLYLLKDSLTLGFKPDDWILYFSYKLLGSDPISKVMSVWSERGLYTTYQVYYMGILDSLFGLNYQAFQKINLSLKIIASLSFYPLILIVFKRKLLAFLTVIIFSISSSAVGPLEFVVKGSDYLAIFWMNLFFIVYFLLVNKLVGWKYYLLCFLLLCLSLAFSPIRMFPIMIIPLLVEIFLILRNFGLHRAKQSIIRMTVIYLPFIILLLRSPVSLLGNAYSPVGITDQVMKGGWYLLLAPLSGIGYTFIPNDFWGLIFGFIRSDTFENYLSFLLGGPTIICAVLTFLLGWSQISILRNRIFFFIIVTLTNFIAQILYFFVAFHHLSTSLAGSVNYDQTTFYSVIFGGYIVIVGLTCFIYWLKFDVKNKILASFWMGSIFTFLFTLLTWAFAPIGTGFNSTNYYLVVASGGSSLMLSSFLISIYDKIKSTRIKKLSFLPLLLLIPIFGMSAHTIHDRFSSLNKDGRGAVGQIALQEEARRVLKDYKSGDLAFVYFDTSEITNGPFYSEGFLTSFPFFMHLKENRIIDGCVGIVYEDRKMVELRKLITVQDGIKGFRYTAICVDKGKGGSKSIFFPKDTFYAFLLKGTKLIDIKESVLQDLNF